MHPLEKLTVPEGCVGIHWFGQNSFGIKSSDGTIIMIDPYFPRSRPADEFIYPIPPLDEKEIRPDFVLLTHDHGDHTCPESLLRINSVFPDTRFYGPTESILRLRVLGIPGEFLSVVVAGEEIRIGSITVYPVYSKSPEGIPEDGIPKPDVEHLGYVIGVQSMRIYISGDLLHTFSRHEELLRPIINLKPDVGLLTTHPTEVEFPDFEGSVEMAVALGLKIAIPSHYGCFVKRTFDPFAWAACFPKLGTIPIVIPYNEAVVFCPSTINHQP